MKKVILILFAIMIVSGCDIVNVKYNSVKDDVSKDIYTQILENDNYIVVDVRTKNEYDSGHVIGSINIPYDEIDENIDLDNTKTIMVYCQSGKRSSIAANALKSLGYDVYDLGAYENISLPKQ